MVKQFRTQGLLAPGLGPSKKAKQRLVLADFESAKEKLQRTFFDPAFGIEHHVRRVDMVALLSRSSLYLPFFSRSSKGMVLTKRN